MQMLTDAQIGTVTGAFWAPDTDMFRVLLDATSVEGGDLAELGALYGASAVLIGSAKQPGETVTVIDLFESSADTDANAAENDSSYSGLTQAAFEANYRRLVGNLPVTIQDFSDRITDHAGHGTHRFVHVDASHLYEHVVKDIDAAATLLKPNGVLVMDDIRQPHTPGVAAATWQAVLRTDLRPFAISPNKLYATWGDPAPWRAALIEWADATKTGYEVQQVNGMDLMRVFPVNEKLRNLVPPAVWFRLEKRPAFRRLIQGRAG